MATKPHAQATGEVVSLRRYTVGGSDAAAAAGIHPYTSPVMLWAEKTGRIDRPETEAMRWGTTLQEVVALDVAERYETQPGGEFSDADRPWLVGHPDGFVTTEAGRRCVLEIKTASAWAHRAGWDDDLPVEYAAQAQVYMHLTGIDRTLIACLVGGQRLIERWVVRDGQAIRLLLEACERFHDHLVRDTPPPPDGHAATRKALTSLYPQAVKDRVYRLSRAEASVLAELRDLKRRRDSLDEQIAERENVLRLALADAEVAIDHADREVIRYRSHPRKSVDVKLLREKLPELARDYETTTTTRRFEVL